MTSSAQPPVPEGTVRTAIADGIGTVEFAHPKGNSLPAKLLNELAAAITAVGEDPAARVVVLRSGGQSTFCAGASFDEFTAVADAAAGQEFFSGNPAWVANGDTVTITSGTESIELQKK